MYYTKSINLVTTPNELDIHLHIFSLVEFHNENKRYRTKINRSRSATERSKNQYFFANKLHNRKAAPTVRLPNRKSVKADRRTMAFCDIEKPSKDTPRPYMASEEDLSRVLAHNRLYRL